MLLRKKIDSANTQKGDVNQIKANMGSELIALTNEIQQQNDLDVDGFKEIWIVRK